MQRMYDGWTLRAWGLMDMADSLLSSSSMRVKPLNTRTRKTAWKERRRLANAPRGIQRRMLKRR